VVTTGGDGVEGGAEVDGALGALRKVLGYQDFRGAQQQIIDHLIDGGDALVLMPTGGGKSLRRHGDLRSSPSWPTRSRPCVPPASAPDS
jgi:hypothetical protein